MGLRLHRLNPAFQAFFTPEAAAPFLIGATLVGILSNACFQALTNRLGIGTGAMALIAVGTVAALFFAVVILYWVLTRSRPVDPPPGRSPDPRRGLIFLVGKPEVFRESIKPHEGSLKRIWLICSPQTMKDADAIRADQEREGREVEVRVVNDVNDPLEFFREIRRIYSRLPDGWSIGDVIADYVGMTAHASVGMVLACLNAKPGCNSRRRFTTSSWAILGLCRPSRSS